MIYFNPLFMPSLFQMDSTSANLMAKVVSTFCRFCDCLTQQQKETSRRLYSKVDEGSKSRAETKSRTKTDYRI